MALGRSKNGFFASIADKLGTSHPRFFQRGLQLPYWYCSAQQQVGLDLQNGMEEVWMRLLRKFWKQCQVWLFQHANTSFSNVDFWIIRNCIKSSDCSQTRSSCCSSCEGSDNKSWGSYGTVFRFGSCWPSFHN